MSVKNIVLWRILPVTSLALACFIGYVSQHEIPIGLLFAIFAPISKGVLPSHIFGHGKMKGTPQVPDDLSPQPRPEKEMFLSLPGGYQMPQNGIGMCCRASAYDDELVYRSTLWYLLLGGRHIDGAHLYINSKAIGRGIREAMRRGVKREEIFVTSKIFPTHYGYESAIKVAKVELENFGLDYIDLFLLHFPSSPPFVRSPCTKEGKGASQCRKETWEALSELRNQGLIRNVGVSNFAVKHIQELEALTDVAPIANNQINFNPFVPEEVYETVQYCHARNITVTAYMPLGGSWQRALVNEKLADLSTELGKSVSQIMLRWALLTGCAIIPGTGNPNHMKENLDVYETELSDADMKKVNELKYSAKGFMHMDMAKLD